jgi:recombination protein RecR
VQLPSSIQNLIEEFSKLPTIGRKSAERFVFYLLQKPQSELDSFANALTNLKINVTHCAQCGAFSETNPCVICANQNRDKTAICVVTETRNIVLIEQTKTFNGAYHVLGGLIDTAKNVTPEQLNIPSLIQRLHNNPQVTEIIVALNPTFEGETTALYLQKVLKDFNIKITRLARGLPTGADIEYADEQTLAEALKHRF